MPSWTGHSKKRADYQFLAIREPLRQLPLGDAAQLPFPTQEFAHKGTYKLFDMVTDLKTAGDLVVAGTVRQERGSPLGHENRPGRRAAPIRVVRRQ